MLKIRMDLSELQRTDQYLGDVRKRFKSERQKLALDIALAVRDLAIRRVKETKTAPDGQPWRPWADSYAATRGPSHSLLIDSRKLLNSFKARGTPGGQAARIWNTAPYASFVQKSRPFLGVGAEERNAAEEAARRWMERVMR